MNVPAFDGELLTHTIRLIGYGFVVAPPNRPRHRLSDVGPLASVAATDCLLDQIGRGDYTGSDVVGRALSAYRDEVLGPDVESQVSETSLNRILSIYHDEVLGSLDSRPGDGGDPWRELTATLAAGALMLTLVAIAVTLAVSTPAGVTLLVTAASWGLISAAIVRISRRPR